MESVVDYGIGMGLSSSKQISKVMGGNVQVLSSSAGNTIF